MNVVKKFTRKATTFRLFILLLTCIFVYYYIPNTVDAPSTKIDSKIQIEILPDGEEKANRVIAAFRHCWMGYKESAWSKDELLPISRQGNDWFSLGLTIVDALDSAYLMGQHDIFKEARDWVSSDLTFDHQEVNLILIKGRIECF